MNVEQKKRRKRYRIKSKVRFTVFIVFIVLTMINTYHLITGNQIVESLTKITYQEVQIAPGDHLWTLAKKFGPDGVDTRYVVYEICKINQISANELTPGQIILIPNYI